MKLSLGAFEAKVGREDIFKSAVENERLHEINDDNGIRLVNFSTSKDIIIKSSVFPHHIIHKYALSSLDGNLHNQLDYVVIDKRWNSSVVMSDFVEELTVIK
jgi:hypothetical protein